MSYLPTLRGGEWRETATTQWNWEQGATFCAASRLEQSKLNPRAPSWGVSVSLWHTILSLSRPMATGPQQEVSQAELAVSLTWTTAHHHGKLSYRFHFHFLRPGRSTGWCCSLRPRPPFCLCLHEDLQPLLHLKPLFQWSSPDMGL